MADGIVCPQHLRETLEWMKYDLEQNRLEVEVVPAPDQHHCGHGIRAVVGQNPQWYRDLCEMFPRTRRKRNVRYVDSTVKRADVFKCLNDMLAGGSKSQFARPILDMCADMEQQMREECGNGYEYEVGC